MTVILIEIGVLGTVYNSLEKILEISERIETLLTTVFLRPLGTLKRVLET